MAAVKWRVEELKVKESVKRHQVMWISMMMSGGGQVGVMRCLQEPPEMRRLRRPREMRSMR